MKTDITRTSALPAARVLVPSAFLATPSHARTSAADVERIKGATSNGPILVAPMSQLAGTSLSTRKGLVRAGVTVQAVGDVRGVPPRGRPV